MSSKKAVTSAIRHVKPILSVDRNESKRRVLNLYKAWYRQIPYIVMEYDLPKNITQCREKLREEFVKNKHVTDIRVLDMLVIKGQMGLKEVVNIWIQKGAIMNYWKETHEPKPTDFLSKFMAGTN
uniref:NADH dehydrogenase [ubiquinone] 1 alpha subcomplex subunit 6 n=1 Tax=Triatoma dimidiata TaxID=72491 RepID=A0A0V0G6U0_TRIDM